MKKYLFLLLTSLSFLAAMDPPEGDDATTQFDDRMPPLSRLTERQQEIMQFLQGVILTEQFYKFAQKKIPLLKIQIETAESAQLFLDAVSDKSPLKSKNPGNISTLFQEPELKSLLLQMRSQFSKTLRNLEKGHALLFDDNLAQMVTALGSFGHPFAKEITRHFDAYQQLQKLFLQELKLYQKNKGAKISKECYSFATMHRELAKLKVSSYLLHVAQLAKIVEQYKHKRGSHILWYGYLYLELPGEFHPFFKKAFSKFGGDLFYNELLGANALEGKNPQEKAENQDAKMLQSAALAPKPKQEIVTDFQQSLTSPAQLLQERFCRSYLRIRSFGPHVVQLVDTRTNREFELYNATGNTDHCDLAQFDSLAKKQPRLDRRVVRWFGDKNETMRQVENGNGRLIDGQLRENWIRFHQLPVRLLYHLRKMGYKGVFYDKKDRRIRTLSLVGRLKEGEGYSQDGLFVFGFSPNQASTIYHACFEPRESFSNVLQGLPTKQVKQNSFYGKKRAQIKTV